MFFTELKNGSNGDVFLGDISVYYCWEHGDVPGDALKSLQLDKDAWIRENLNDQQKFEAVADLLQDWKLYTAKNGERVWLIDTFKNPNLYYTLTQMIRGIPPEALAWLNTK